jgi:2,3-dihydroxybenzoate-AMP ligase
MLEGCVPWPPELAAQYREAGLWEGVTISEMVERTARRQPDQMAVVHGERRIRYAELVRASKRLALALHGCGIGRRDRVVMQLPNTPDFIVVYLALNWIGAIPVMALRAHREAEIRHFIGASRAVGYLIPDVVSGFDHRVLAQTMQQAFPALRHVIVAGDPLPGQLALQQLEAGASDDATPDAAVPDDASLDTALQPLRPEPGEVATMLLSGGTTALSKLIPRTHDDYVLNARLCSAAAGFDSDTVFMAILPLAHNYNLASPGILGTFYRGGRVVLAAAGDAETVCATIERERVTAVAAAVPLIAGWLASDAPERHDLGSLRVVQNGGARLPPELRQRLRERFGCVPQEIYGTAEGLINMTRLDDADELLLESSGAPVSELDEIRVVDDEGRGVADDEPGELLTRGPYTIRGYYDAPQQNRDAFTVDGFYRMGDIVRRRGRYLYTEGRRKDMINRGGEKISCDEVENLICRHPKVKSAALVAMPDPVFGEKACACVIAHEGESLAFDELVAFLRAQRIASYKLPERLEVMREFPVSPVGKIVKRQLREQVAARIAEEAASG